MKKLFIDTTDNKEITIGLFIDQKKYVIKKQLEKYKAQVALPLIEELLQKHTLTLQDLDAITVNPGPGSFTGVRVGVSIANALSFTLGIPVNAISVSGEDNVVEPVYE